MSKRVARVTDAAGFVLQSTAWRETSLIVKAFARDHGVVTLVAKGAKRPYSGLRAVLMPFQPLMLSWTGSAEVKTLTHAEVVRVKPMPGAGLMSCWYMNELLLRLLAIEDPHPGLYLAYAEALDALAQGHGAARVLRQFEWRLLHETGYGLEGPMPDFQQREPAVDFKEQLQQRLLEHVPGGRLNSREVMLGLRRVMIQTTTPATQTT
jgi:DNA repair protein RecO (recombination protein O)